MAIATSVIYVCSIVHGRTRITHIIVVFFDCILLSCFIINTNHHIQLR